MQIAQTQNNSQPSFPNRAVNLLGDDPVGLLNYIVKKEGEIKAALLIWATKKKSTVI